MERRHFLALLSLIFTTRLKAKTPIQLTPEQAEGPFYPVDRIPLRSNLLLQTEGLIGEPIILQGKVVDTTGNPVSGIKLEIWQCDGQGIYSHPNQPNNDMFDAHFAGFTRLKPNRMDATYSRHCILYLTHLVRHISMLNCGVVIKSYLQPSCTKR